MTKELVLLNLKKRKSAEALDFFIVLFLTGIMGGLGAIINIYFLFIFLFSFPFLYLGVLPYGTKGSTLSGLLFGIQTVFFDKNNKRIYPKPIAYIKRLFFFLKSNRNFSGIFLESYKINSRGQLDMDEKYNTTVISKGIKIDFSKKINYYIFEAKKDNLYEQIQKVGTLLKRMLQFLLFGFLFLGILFKFVLEQ